MAQDQTESEHRPCLSNHYTYLMIITSIHWCLMQQHCAKLSVSIHLIYKIPVKWVQLSFSVST